MQFLIINQAKRDLNKSLQNNCEKSYRIKIKKKLTIMPFSKLVQAEYRIGKRINDFCDSPYLFVTISIFAIPIGVAPNPAPIKPDVSTAES